jgi:hypothetical protein
MLKAVKLPAVPSRTTTPTGGTPIRSGPKISGALGFQGSREATRPCGTHSSDMSVRDAWASTQGQELACGRLLKANVSGTTVAQ